MSRVFNLKIIAPDRIFYEGLAGFVEFTTTEGEVGVYANHMPMTNILAPGIIQIYEGEDISGEPKKAAMHSGFCEILEDSVTILAEVVEWPEEIDMNRAEEARIRAERRIREHNDSTNMDRAELALKKAMIRLELKK